MRGSVTLLLALSVTSQAQGTLRQSFAPPGQLVDLAGRKLHLHCTGRGAPTVILVAGGGAYAIDWALVQPKVADSTRVCSYDRAGLGWSDPGPAEETVEETVDDLHRLLTAANERGPFVLTGASIGGIYVRAYQHRFPNEVAGLVFANSSHRVGMQVKGKGGLIWDLSEADLRSAFPPANASKGERPTSEGDPFDRLPPDLQSARLWLDQRMWDRYDPAKAGPASILSWRTEFIRELNESCSGAQHPLGALPVLVLGSDPSASQRAREGTLGRRFCDRSDGGDGLELLSSNAAYRVATGSGHEIHLYQPDTVVRALLDMVRAVRRHTPLIGDSM